MTRLNETRAPGELVWSRELPAHTGSPYLARRATGAVLRSLRLFPDAIETAQLLVSELVTNAVKFGGNPHFSSSEDSEPERIDLALRYSAAQLIIEVSDNNPRPPVLAAPDSDAEGGRGLITVEGLSKDWGYTRLSPRQKTVYCVVAI
jgi:two-component sensor histidine kinase